MILSEPTETLRAESCTSMTALASFKVTARSSDANDNLTPSPPAAMVVSPITMSCSRDSDVVTRVTALGRTINTLDLSINFSEIFGEET